jgi:pimeloyl-ACP methyl ester carboxylesterase
MMRKISAVDSVRIAIYEYAANSHCGANLLFSHATGFHGRVFNTTINCMGNDFKCTSLDHRAHGQSSRNGSTPLDWNILGEDVMRVCEEVDPRSKFIGVGHSMGAAALILSALKYPHIFRGLVLFEPVVFPWEWRIGSRLLVTFGGDAPLAKLCKRRRNKFESLDFAVNNFASKPPMNVFDRRVLEDYVKYGLTSSENGTPVGDVKESADTRESLRLCCEPINEAEMYNTMPSNTSFSQLSKLTEKMPVLLLSGRVEPYQVSALAQRQLAAMGPEKCKFEEWSDAGHFGPFEYPERLAERIKEFAVSLPPL